MTINQFYELSPKEMQVYLCALDLKNNPKVWALQLKHAIKINAPKLVSFNNQLSIAFEKIKNHLTANVEA